MSDVARAAGVSPMTVSNVVNGRGGVSDEVRRRVLHQLSKSGYRMNVSARNLRSGRSGVIGLAVPELRSGYFGHLSSLIIDAAADHGYRVAVEKTDAGAAGELAAISLSRAMDYDGLIITTVQLDVDEQVAANLPIVLLGERRTATNLDHIALPNHAGAQAATELLLQRGCRRIAYVGSDLESEHVLRLRVDGYLEALRQRGIDPEPTWGVPLSGLTAAQGRRAARALRDLRADGALAATDDVALGLLRGLADLGMQVPGDIRVAGFDDVPAAELSIPSLTTVSPDHAWTAQRAIELLVARIGQDGGERRDEIAPFTLIERESTSL